MTRYKSIPLLLVLYIAAAGCSGSTGKLDEGGGEGSSRGIEGIGTTNNFFPSSSSIVASSPNYKAWIGATSILNKGTSGLSANERYQMSDPALEMGIYAVEKGEK